MRMIYNVHFLGFGNVRQGRCHDLEIAIQHIADNCDQIMCISPYTLPTATPKIVQDSQPAMQAGILPGMLIISMHLEKEPEKKEPEEVKEPANAADGI